MEDIGILLAIWSILRLFDICSLWLFGIFMAIRYLFSHFEMLYQEKSGNPAHDVYVPFNYNKTFQRVSNWAASL
jgi:hypothetical protein